MMDTTCCTVAFAFPLSLTTYFTSPSIKHALKVLNYNMMEQLEFELNQLYKVF